MRCSKCGAVQNGGAQVVQLLGYMDRITDVNVFHLLDAIDALANTRVGQEYIASRHPQNLFWTVSEEFRIESPIPDEDRPGRHEQIWPKEIWAAYYATLLKYTPGVLNADQTMTIRQIYHIVLAGDISALVNDYFNQEMLEDR